MGRVVQSFLRPDFLLFISHFLFHFPPISLTFAVLSQTVGSGVPAANWMQSPKGDI